MKRNGKTIYKKFEEEYPSLKGKQQKHTGCTIHYKDNTTDHMPECEVFYSNQIEECCKDNQKIKEAIGNDNNILVVAIPGPEPFGIRIIKQERQRILKELKL